jgi:peptide/nickel transport system ATP-binding protein
MLFVTHNLPVVSRMTDRVLVLQGGRIVESGTVRQVFSSPEHTYTRALVASAQAFDSVLEAS